jgi:hypothetical protein
MKHVGTNMRTGFNDFISDCLKQQKNNNVYVASKTRKRAFELGPSQPRAPMANRSMYRLPAPGARFRPPQRKIRMPNNLRGTRGHSRWRYHKPRQDKVARLELLLQ